jgi:hypothetical protein
MKLAAGDHSNCPAKSHTHSKTENPPAGSQPPQWSLKSLGELPKQQPAPSPCRRRGGGSISTKRTRSRPQALLGGASTMGRPKPQRGTPKGECSCPTGPHPDPTSIRMRVRMQ